MKNSGVIPNCSYSLKGKYLGQSEDIVVEFVVNAYVGIVEWWIKNNMPYSPREMAEKVGELIERVVD